MALSWVRENPPRWDEGKQRIVGGAPVGIFDARLRTLPLGEQVPGEWWRVELDGRTVGYGWMDVVWGDAEILLATDREHQSQGVGIFILERLDAEAASRGLNYLTNIVRPTHPNAAEVTAWLIRRGFDSVEDGRLVRRVNRP